MNSGPCSPFCIGETIGAVRGAYNISDLLPVGSGITYVVTSLRIGEHYMGWEFKCSGSDKWHPASLFEKKDAADAADGSVIIDGEWLSRIGFVDEPVSSMNGFQLNGQFFYFVEGFSYWTIQHYNSVHLVNRRDVRNACIFLGIKLKESK